MKEIASAFVRAQKAFGPALKSSTNPHFKSKYADLAACVEAVIEALNTNGIGLMQPCHESPSGVIVETLFVHESGETMSAGRLHVPAAKNDPQGYGSAITYARRYSLMAACGIAPEDDDGNAASKKSGPIVQPRKDIGADLPEDWKTYLRDLAEHVTGLVKQNKSADAVDAIRAAKLEPEQHTYMHDHLDSAVRSALRKLDGAVVRAA